MPSKNPENLFRRGDVWWIRYNVNGQKIRRSLGTRSIREARRLRAEILGRRASGDQVRAKFGLSAAPMEGAPVPTLGEVSNEWLTAHEIAKNAPNTIKAYTAALDCWIRPTFGHRRMGDITRADVRSFIATLRAAKGHTGSPLSDDQVAYVFGRLRSLFLFARRESLWVGADPTDLPKQERPQPGAGRTVVLTLDELQRFIGELDGRWYYMVSVAAYAGLSVAEVNGLRWDDIDFDAGTLTVRRNYLEERTKSKARAEPIPLHRDLIALLRMLEAESESEWLFPCRTGKPKKKATEADYRVLREAAIRAGISKHVTWHVFRHSYGTAMYEQLRDPKALKALMRHSDIRITLKRYVHPDREQLAEKANQLPSLIRPRLKAV